MRKTHEYDSDEEKYFSWYLGELLEAGYIKEYKTLPESYVLNGNRCIETTEIG